MPKNGGLLVGSGTAAAVGAEAGGPQAAGAAAGQRALPGGWPQSRRPWTLTFSFSGGPWAV